MRYRHTAVISAVVAIIVACDQATKWYIDTRMMLHESVPVIDGLLNITYVRNAGAAFGLFADSPWQIRVPLFVAVSVGALFLLIMILRGLGPRQGLMRVALAGVLGGAIGNLVDRVRYGEVIDFLDLHWRGHHWPAFNIADSCITIGIAILLLESLLSVSGVAEE